MNTSRANSNQSREGESWKGESWEGAEAGLEHVLRNFRSSVNAWSEAELSRPRMIPAAHRHTWRFAATWALGCLLAAGSFSAGLYQHHRNQLLAGIAHQRQIHQEQLSEQLLAHQATVSTQTGQADEGLMAAVDSDVSRPVPSAMEPLAQLMNENGDQ